MSFCDIPESRIRVLRAIECGRADQNFRPPYVNDNFGRWISDFRFLVGWLAGQGRHFERDCPDVNAKKNR